MLSYQDLLDIGLSPDAEALQARLVAAAAGLGFGLSGGTFIRGRLVSGAAQVVAFGNPPDEFLKASRSLDIGLRDPLLTEMSRRPGCFTYDQTFYTKAGAGDLWDNQAAFGYRTGMAISLHEFSHAELFSFGVDGPDPLPTSATARMELQGALQLIALHAQEAALRLFTPAPSLDPGQVNAPELEALRWAADAEVVWKRGDVTVISKAGQRRQPAAKSRAILRAIEGGVIER